MCTVMKSVQSQPPDQILVARTWDNLTALSTQCPWAVLQGVPVVFFLCTEKSILPAEVSSLEKDGFSNSSFAAISATHTDGVAQPSRHRLGSCTERTAIG